MIYRNMKLLVFVLNDEKHLAEILEAFVEAGVPGATIVDSEGMGRLLTYEVPLFADFKQFVRGNKPYNKTIFSVVEDDSTVGSVVRLVEEICGDLSNPATGILFTVPVDFAKGLHREET